MANKFQKAIYILSALAPVLVVMAIVCWIQNGGWIIPFVLILITAILVLAFGISFGYAKSNIQTVAVKVDGISSMDGRIVIYVISYLLPLITIKIEDIMISILIIVAIVGILCAIGADSIAPNPLLFVLGYHFYRINIAGALSDYCLISKKRLKKEKDVNEVAQIFESLMIRTR